MCSEMCSHKKKDAGHFNISLLNFGSPAHNFKTFPKEDVCLQHGTNILMLCRLVQSGFLSCTDRKSLDTMHSLDWTRGYTCQNCLSFHTDADGRMAMEFEPDHRHVDVLLTEPALADENVKVAATPRVKREVRRSIDRSSRIARVGTRGRDDVQIGSDAVVVSVSRACRHPGSNNMFG